MYVIFHVLKIFDSLSFKRNDLSSGNEKKTEDEENSIMFTTPVYALKF